jgi:hypothetical protein
MAKPLATSEPNHGGIGGNLNGRSAVAVAPGHRDDRADTDGSHLGGGPRPGAGPDTLEEVEHLRSENGQLRSLCIELEQALQEATQHVGGEGGAGGDGPREYETLLEEKSETIRQLHQQLQEAQALVADLEAKASQARTLSGPAPREEELLALSEELETERRQLQEDEHTLMNQMREMEVGMAKERAEMARQRNDLQRLQGEIRHELERLEKNGVAVQKMQEFKSKLQDATNRRGLAQSAPGTNPASQAPAKPVPPAPSREDSLMGRLFGK